MRTDQPWRPLISGEPAQRALRAVERIAAGLPDLPMPRPGSRLSTGAAALGSGQAGQALFWAYLAVSHDDQLAAQRAEACLDAALEEVAGVPLPPTLYGGFPGVGWVEEHLRALLFEPEDEDADFDDDVLTEIDQAVETALEQRPEHQDYDLIRGLVGLGVYALERLPAPGAIRGLEKVVARLAETAVELEEGLSWHTDPALLLPIQREQYPRGHFNVGVAHGVPGVVALLGAACHAGVAVATARPLLSGAVRWLLATEIESPAEHTLARFPTAVVPGVDREASRLAWCYGDPGIAAALLVAARGAGEQSFEAEALRIARQVASCQVAGSGVIDPGLCHGAAGLGHLFNRLYQASGDELLADAARFWFDVTLDQVREDGATGFFTQVPVSDTELEWLEIGGFLNGVAGIGLALLAALSPLEPRWDRVLLVAPPSATSATEAPRHRAAAGLNEPAPAANGRGG